MPKSYTILILLAVKIGWCISKAIIRKIITYSMAYNYTYWITWCHRCKWKCLQLWYVIHKISVMSKNPLTKDYRLSMQISFSAMEWPYTLIGTRLIIFLKVRLFRYDKVCPTLFMQYHIKKKILAWPYSIRNRMFICKNKRKSKSKWDSYVPSNIILNNW